MTGNLKIVSRLLVSTMFLISCGGGESNKSDPGANKTATSAADNQKNAGAPTPTAAPTLTPPPAPTFTAAPKTPLEEAKAAYEAAGKQKVEFARTTLAGSAEQKKFDDEMQRLEKWKKEFTSKLIKDRRSHKDLNTQLTELTNKQKQLPKSSVKSPEAKKLAQEIATIKSAIAKLPPTKKIDKDYAQYKADFSKAYGAASQKYHEAIMKRGGNDYLKKHFEAFKALRAEQAKSKQPQTNGWIFDFDKKKMVKFQ